MPRFQVRKTWPFWIVGLLLVGGMDSTLLLKIPFAGEASRKVECRNNLLVIGLAMMIYHDDNGCFPPPILRDAASGKLRSWRVALTPHDLGSASFCEAYRMDEDWDSDFNLAPSEAEQGRHGYRCPSCSQDPVVETNYVMITGAEQDDAETDSQRRHVLVVEIVGSGIPWTEPRDISIDDLSFRINDPDRLSISSNHEGGAHILWSEFQPPVPGALCLLAS